MTMFGTIVVLHCLCTLVLGIEYHILGLVPLSGPKSTIGWAQWQGMKLGIEEALHTVNDIADVSATFQVNDTECNPVIEHQLILKSFWHLRAGRHLVVIGGGCPPVDQQVSLGALHTSISQLTFEELPAPGSRTYVLSPVTVRISVQADAYANVAQFIQAQHWQRVAIVYDRNKESNVLATEALHKLDIDISLKIELSSLHQHNNILKKSRLRIVVITVDYNEASDIICGHYCFDPVGFRRYIWLLMVTNVTESVKTLQEKCAGDDQPWQNKVIFFQEEEIYVDNKVSQVFSHVVANDLTLISAPSLLIEAAYSYDATKIILDSLRAVGSTVLNENTDVAAKLAVEIKARRWIGVTGRIQIEQDGRRHAHTNIYRFTKVDGSYFSLTHEDRGRKIFIMEENMESDTVGTNAVLEGVPLSLFVVMCALAAIGITYAIAMITFNIAKHRHRAIKMTSPNINVVIMMGCCGVYATMVMLGLDTTRISRSTMEILLQATTYLIAIGFTTVYGLISAKSWRVFMIFKNLSTNGKMTRDEHLLLGLFFMILLDMAVLLPWHLVDPITCSRKVISEVFEPSNMTDTTIEIDVCHSKYQDTWIATLYVYKLIILGLGFLFSWQTRHVTLPALRDTQMVYITIGLVATMALVALPVLLVPSTGVVMTYAVGGLILWMTVTLTITMLFLTKVFLYRKEAKRISHGESFRFQFSESMKRTQEAIRELAGCLCCGAAGEDKYAQEMLLTEIECLKRTIKDKDTTIRELNDRLYVGAHKFHDYLKSPSRQEAMTDASVKKTSLLPEAKFVDANVVNNIQMGQNNGYSSHSNANEQNKCNRIENDEHMIIRSGSTTDESKHNELRYNPDISPSYVHLAQQPNAHRGYQYSSLPRNHDEFANVRFQQRERRPSVHSYHDNEIRSARERPIYTIDVREGPHQKEAPIQIHMIPTITRVQQNTDVLHYEKHSPNSSTNFDSAIDNNSPSSTSSSDSFPHPSWRHQNEPIHIINTKDERPINEKLRSCDVRNGGIDLEAIENEAADPHRYWNERILPKTGDSSSRGHQYSPRHEGYHPDMMEPPNVHLNSDQYSTRSLYGYHKNGVSQVSDI